MNKNVNGLLSAVSKKSAVGIRGMLMLSAKELLQLGHGVNDNHYASLASMSGEAIAQALYKSMKSIPNKIFTSDAQIAGMVGNIMRESGGDPLRIEGCFSFGNLDHKKRHLGDGVSLLQWTNSGRKLPAIELAVKYAKQMNPQAPDIAIGSPIPWLRVIVSELASPAEAGSLRRIRASGDNVSEATLAITKFFVRPSISAFAISERTEWARIAMS